MLLHYLILFYINLIKKCHKRNKKVGLSVCSVETFKEIKDLKFDFYKLLSIGINNFKLIKQLKIQKKPVFISTGFGASDLNIKKCLKAFGVKKKLTLLHSPMTYDPSKINFNRIINLKKKIKIPVGYSNHNNNFNNINVLSAYKPDAIFVYCKPKKKKSRIYPDDKHAFFLDELDKMRNDYISCLSMNELSRNVKKVNIFKDEFKI